MRSLCKATSLSIIDSTIFCLHKLLEAFNSAQQLNQLVFIYNDDSSETDETDIVNELRQADI